MERGQCRAEIIKSVPVVSIEKSPEVVEDEDDCNDIFNLFVKRRGEFGVVELARCRADIGRPAGRPPSRR